MNEITNLIPTVVYQGTHRDLVQLSGEWYCNERMTDYDGRCQISFSEVATFRTLMDAVFKHFGIDDTSDNSVANRCERIIDAINDKTTKIVLLIDEVLMEIDKAENEINNVSELTFRLGARYYILISKVEAIIWYNSSVLDQIARLSTIFSDQFGYKFSKDQKFGKHRRIVSEIESLKKYVELLNQFKWLNLSHEIRNDLSHEKKLLLIPLKRDNAWSFGICTGDNPGFWVKDFIQNLSVDLCHLVQLLEVFYINLLEEKK